MRWSNRNDDDNLDSLLRRDDGGRLGSALVELQEKAPPAPPALRERISELAAGEARETPLRRPRLARRLSPAYAGAALAAVLAVAVAIPAIAAFTGDGTSSEAGDAVVAGVGPPVQRDDAQPPPRSVQPGGAPLLVSPPPPPQAAEGAGGGFPVPKARQGAPVPSTTRAQDYSSRIKLHVDGHEKLSEAVQSAIRSTRQLGGYVTYVDYGTSGKRDGGAELSVRVPVGRVQTAVARFSQLGTILEQQTEIRDLQGQIDRITRDIQARRDRIAKLEAELKDPTLGKAERDRLEARLVRAKRGLANAMRGRAGVLRQSRYAKLDLAFTTAEPKEAAPPPSGLKRALDDAAGILASELAVLLYVLIAGAPFILLAALAVIGVRALRRGANTRVLERA
jgi:Domain of unknown function (DUF4349)